MKKILIVLFIFPLLLFAQHEKKIALVIGNSNYDLGILPNPINDAFLIANTLDSLGFDTILAIDIPSKQSFDNIISNFSNKRLNYDVAVLYYSGHAVEIEGENYLLPTKEVFKTKSNVSDVAVNVHSIMNLLSTQEEIKKNIIILDACRNNPLGWGGAGLAKMEPPVGSLIAFSAEVRKKAYDGKGKNSLYSKVLSENMLMPNVEIKNIFQKVRTNIVKQTQDKQVPVEYSKLTHDSFYFKKSRIHIDDDDIFLMFYNVENLFDTINNPHTNDDTFLPNSDKEWNTDKYYHKLDQLSKVFSSINNGLFPDLIALSEVENKLVIQDLLKNPFFNNHNYYIIHEDSPDIRGIDCAVLIDTTRFDVNAYNFLDINLPSSRPTRDIVHVELEYENEIIHLFVNHWPSRWGGEEATEHKRMYAAKRLQYYLQKNISENHHVIIMGDFNDEPYSNSTKSFSLLEGVTDYDKTYFKKIGFSTDDIEDDDFSKTSLLVNLMVQIQQKYKRGTLGSYAYRGEWKFLDQIIINPNLYYGRKTKLVLKQYDAYRPEFLLDVNSEGESYPRRTFGGDNWYGGFSDHLPVYCIFDVLNCIHDE